MAQKTGLRGGLAEEAGLALKIDDEFANIFDEYWHVDAESFQSFGERMAQELNGMFKIRDTVAVLAKRGTGLSPSGLALPTVTAAWGDNLISWDITPRQPRPMHAKTAVRYFDRKTTATVKSEVVEHDGVDNKVNQMIKTLAPDETTAKRVAAAARGGEQERAKGGGSVEILPDPTAKAEGKLVLKGARQDVDGEYRMSQVKLSGNDSSGNTQKIEVKEPKGGAGVDDR